MIKKIFALLSLMMLSSTAFANWSWNVGYNNPPGASIGVNFMHTWSQWAVEIGVGYANAENKKDDPDTPEDETDEKSAVVAGDVNVKYFFDGRGRTFKPYVQVGTGFGLALTADDDLGAAAGLGGAFGGVGFMLGDRPFYFYSSLNVGPDNAFVQLGFGFGF